MTDNEIIKALECCFKMESCGHCPLYSTDPDIKECTTTLSKNALDLINRQKAEIEKAKRYVKTALTILSESKLYGEPITDMSVFQKYIDKLNARAIKEFAERLKEKAQSHSCRYNGCVYGITAVEIKEIDNLVKEMTEGNQYRKQSKRR